MAENNKSEAKNHDDELQLEEAIEQLLPTKLRRRDTLALFSGFDQEANRKLLGAIYQVMRR